VRTGESAGASAFACAVGIALVLGLLLPSAAHDAVSCEVMACLLHNP
jgi:hypothetical protein